MRQPTANQEQGAATGAGVLEYEPTGRRVWRVANLTYTLGALVVLFSWLLLGDFSFQLKERGAVPMMQLLLRKYNASNLLMGMLVGSLPQALGAIFGPIIAYRSDRHRGPWGRRIPYLIIATPLTVVGMVGLGFSPALGQWVARSWAHADWARPATLWSFAIFWTIFEVASVMCTSLLLALVNDVVPRPLLGRFFGLFRVFSVAAGIVFGWYLMGRVDAHYLAIFVGIGAVYGLSFGSMCFAVREPEYPPPAPSAGGPWAATKTYLRECFSEPYYLWYFASVTAAYIAFQPINLFSLYFAKSVGISNDWYGKLGAFQLGLSLLLSAPFGWLVDKYHPIRLTMLALILHGTGTLVAFALVRGPIGFSAAHIICGCLAGLWITAWYPLTPCLVPKAKFGQYYAAMTMVHSTAQFFGAMALGKLFDAMHSQYRYMYLVAGTFDFLAVALTLVVYRYFKRYGGLTDHYVPPDSDNEVQPTGE